MAVVDPLCVRGLSRSYGELEALRALDLEVAAGECVALIGHNGSGKTTAIRLIAGLLEPTAGEVVICGHRMHGEPGSLEARADLAVLLDSPLLYGDLTVSDHLELVAVAHGVDDDGLGERITEILTELGLDGRRDARPGQLSRGMRQKLALACVIVRPFQVLALDEPVVGLDPATQSMLRELLLAAKQQGVAVLLTTHQLAFARGIADRAVLLAEGAVVEQGPYDAVIDGQRVNERGLH
jgi:ABC-2 type transport system ATP-binding protein